jgi:hypothetical protein
MNCGSNNGHHGNDGTAKSEANIMNHKQRHTDDKSTNGKKLVWMDALALTEEPANEHAWNCANPRKLVKSDRVYHEVEVRGNK